MVQLVGKEAVANFQWRKVVGGGLDKVLNCPAGGDFHLVGTWGIIDSCVFYTVFPTTL